MFTLRKYRHEDFERLLEIDRACFVEGIAYNADEMRFFLSMPSAITLVGVKGRTIQGFIVADRFRQRPASRFIGRIITIDVAPAAQHRGLGALLLSAAEEELRRTRCDYISLEVAVDNESALRFYKKHGYSVMKVLPRYYLDSIDGLLMAKSCEGSGGQRGR